MDLHETQAVRANVQNDLARLEEEIAELRRLDVYLAKKEASLTNPGQALPAASVPVNGSANSVNLASALRQLNSGFTQVEAAEIVLRDAGPDHPMTAKAIAQAIASRGFPRAADTDFSSSLFSTMSRRTDVFAKASPGHWTLAEFKVDPKES